MWAIIIIVPAAIIARLFFWVFANTLHFLAPPTLYCTGLARRPPTRQPLHSLNISLSNRISTEKTTQGTWNHYCHFMPTNRNQPAWHASFPSKLTLPLSATTTSYPSYSTQTSYFPLILGSWLCSTHSKGRRSHHTGTCSLELDLSSLSFLLLHSTKVSFISLAIFLSLFNLSLLDPFNQHLNML